MHSCKSAILALLTVAGCAVHQPGDGPGERLIAAVPEGWHNVVRLENEMTRFSEFVPEDETDSNWQSRLSFEAFSATTIQMDPIDILDAETLEDQKRCNFVQHYNVFSGYENNYQTSVRLFLCGERTTAGPSTGPSTQQGEVKLVKIIRGRLFLHSIRLVQRLEAFDAGEQDFQNSRMADWSLFMNQIRLCDGSSQHPCPTKDEDNG